MVSQTPFHVTCQGRHIQIDSGMEANVYDAIAIVLATCPDQRLPTR